ncbi:MAG: serine/threonine protein kinase, partial [Actinomycetota bacterium]|nr:serine/threonine protein kinase [Actinomycetota bacterium]
MATSRIAEHVGRVLGNRYRLTRPLGTGASAHVYVAEDVTLRRRVAVKVLHPALADDEAFQRRFQAEARVVAALRHPGIVRVYDWGDDGGAPYLVMELLEGGSLRALLDRGHLLSPAQAARVGADSARALDYAHRRGLVHRDIKPANLLFDDEGHVSVADFGLARALAEATWTEPVGTMLGTARYAAPEQLSAVGLDGKADVYALALVLVEAMTGKVPFSADTTIGTLMARVDKALPVPDEAGPLAPVIARAGTAGPAERIDAGELAAGLEE